MPRQVLVFALAVALSCFGCLPQSRAPEPYKEYLVSYDPPVKGPGEREVAPAALKVNRFATAATIVDPSVVVRTGPYTMHTIAYRGWRVMPGEMVGGLLVRDLRESGLFPAVFSPHELGEARAGLDGLVEDFSEHREKRGRRAVLKVRLTLLSTRLEAAEDRVIFQKAYTQEEPVKSPGVEGLARAMSLAVERFSREAVGDIYEALLKFED